MLGVIGLLLIIALFAFYGGSAFLGSFFLIAATAFFSAQIFKSGAILAKDCGKAAAKDVKKELGKIGKTDTLYPEGKARDLLKETGEKAGEFVFVENGAWSSGESSKQFKSKLGKTANKIISKFFGFFK